MDKEIALPRFDFKGAQSGVKYLEDGSVNIEPRGDLAVQKKSVANDEYFASMKGENSPAPAFTIIDSEENLLGSKTLLIFLIYRREITSLSLNQFFSTKKNG